MKSARKTNRKRDGIKIPPLVSKVKTLVSEPVSKKPGFVSEFYEGSNGNGFWEIRSRFPKIPFVSQYVYNRGETRNESLGGPAPSLVCPMACSMACLALFIDGN
jgi:hypothetical protein